MLPKTIKQFNIFIRIDLLKWIVSFLTKDFAINILRNIIRKYFNKYWQELYFRMDFYYVGVFGIGASEDDIRYVKNYKLDMLNNFEWKIMKKELIELEAYRLNFFKKVYST